MPDATPGLTQPAPAPEAAASRPRVKRHLKNYLLDRTMQLRLAFYAAFAVLCTGAGVGFFYLRAQVDATKVQALGDPTLDAGIQEILAAEDRRNAIVLFTVLSVVVAGLVMLAIKVTHKVAGPAFVIGRHARSLAEGKLPDVRPLRKGDLLQDLGHDFATGVQVLRTREREESERLVELARRLPEEGAAAEVRAALEELAREKARRARGE